MLAGIMNFRLTELLTDLINCKKENRKAMCTIYTIAYTVVEIKIDYTNGD
jgi:hypothetical protein